MIPANKHQSYPTAVQEPKSLQPCDAGASPINARDPSQSGDSGAAGDASEQTHSPARHRKLAGRSGPINQSRELAATGGIRRVISRCTSHPQDRGTSAHSSYLVGCVRWVLTFFFSVFYLTPYAFLLTEGQEGERA